MRRKKRMKQWREPNRIHIKKYQSRLRFSESAFFLQSHHKKINL